MAWVTMPQLGETIAEGTIGRWLKQVGDRVERGEPIVEVITDKANAEVPSDVAGEVREILVPEGASAAAGTRLALVTDTGESSAAAESVSPAVAVLSPRPTLAGEEGSAPDGGPAQAPVSAAAVPPAAGPSPRPTAPAGRTGPAGRVTPAVRRLARENDVDLGDVPGTGPADRVTVEDVLAYLVRRRLAAGESATVTAPARAASASGSSALPAAVAPVAPAALVASSSAAMAIEVDMSGVAALVARATREETVGEESDMLPLALILKAAVEALRLLPHLGMAAGANVGVDVVGPAGAVRGVVRDPGRLSVLGVNRALRALAETGHAGPGRALTPDLSQPDLALPDLTPPALVVGDAGGAGVLSSVPSLAAGQAIALAVGATVPRPVALESAGGTALGVRRVAVLTASYDPAVVPSSAAAGFLAAVRARLEAAADGTPIS